MKAVVTVIAGMVLASGLTLSAAPQDAAKVAAGKKAYEANKCSTCHKIAGVGKMSELDGVGSKLSAAEIKQWLVDPKAMEAKLPTKPKISMKNYKALPAEEIDALVAYMLSLKK